ncbi:cyclic diguanylate phosphodiesterase [Desulfomarina profundi]|uniref:Cyclic diguanylate phosphodiesterase n=1 Tax=Desulfomarina profundi TaxID=2772557 RepID=A0A8D5JRH6_9BACT|nr:HD domain-containing phosphohydrolase [Desulfomarina profundi]BCL61056.1 cyclic diguanylate phosphodiesterase [Desulfomarina profundi]
MKMAVTETVHEIILLLSKGLSNRKLYHSDHPRVVGYAREIVSLLHAYFVATEKEKLFIGIVDDFFIYDGKRIFGSDVSGKQLMDLAKSLDCGGFLMEKGLVLEEVKAFFDISSLQRVLHQDFEETQEVFKRHGIRHIKGGHHFRDKDEEIAGKSGKKWEGQKTIEEQQSVVQLYSMLFDVVNRAHSKAALSYQLDIDEARSVCEFMLRFSGRSFAEVLQYVHYPEYDGYTVGHSVRVASLAVYAGMRMRWKKKDILAMGTAGLLHDIGKAAIPDHILLKQGRLTAEEYRIIQKHPRKGVELLMEHSGVSSLQLTATWGHHIRFDRSGYPPQPSWAVRHPTTALLQICDVFEALTAVRPYKKAIMPVEAYAIMVADEGAFHPGLLASFIGMVGFYPPGTYVRLSDNRVGMVVRPGKMLDRPCVKIVATKEGESLDPQEQYEVNLGRNHPNSMNIQELLFDRTPDGKLMKKGS